MGYSINYYLDNAISRNAQKAIKNSKNKDIINRIDEKPLQIFIYLRYSGKTIKAYTERRCTQKEWDSHKQRVNPRYFKSGSTMLNSYLDRIHNRISSLYEENLKLEIPTTKEHIKEIIYKANLKDVNRLSNHNFKDIFQEFITQSELKKQYNTIKSYHTCIKHLKRFSESKNIPLNFQNIDLSFESRLREYFIKEVGLTNNTIAKYIKILKVFLSYCTDMGYNTKMDFKKFDVSEKPGEIYILTSEELMRMYYYNFKNERLAQVRDVFCFGCFTSARFGEIENLKWEDIKEDTIQFYESKKKETKIIPLNVFSKNILEKYKGKDKPLPVISNQKTNEYLKEIGKILELNEPVRILKYRGAEKIESYVPKYEVLTFHVSRKTFITNSLIKGMSERDLREFSGHKNDASFNRYVKFSNDFKFQKMNEFWNEDQFAKPQGS
jgi:integrase